ncbi:Os04g0574500 [Oryza sativa Japonica Group]|nr:Os04g0574500 [Oryza sativa Japonica Group]|eukprot:NP_001053618.1 Os04g0574500 [Oryza sativa Japonica Group]
MEEHRRRLLVRPAKLSLPDGPGEPVLRLQEQHGAGAGAVPAHGRQEVAVLARRGAGAQVLRAARPPWPRPFKKAYGSLCSSRSHISPGPAGTPHRRHPRHQRAIAVAPRFLLRQQSAPRPHHHRHHARYLISLLSPRIMPVHCL